jgi:REP element-mobilizing transposase RayT
MLTWNAGSLASRDARFERYLLTFWTDRRRHLLVSRERVDLVISQILRAACDESFATAAYCAMPDCVHVLIEAQSTAADHKRFINRAKQLSAFQYSRSFHERLWQRHNFARALEPEESTLAAARHVLEQPVRAGLAPSAAEYVFAGSGLYAVSTILAADTV